MKALTICNPYAELVARGASVKPIENRTWYTSYRGALLIHAGKSKAWMDDAEAYGLREAELVFGAIVAAARLVACLSIDAPWPEPYAHLKDHQHANGPFCLVIAGVNRLARPVPCKGAQGLWVPSPALVEQVRSVEVA